MKRSLFRIMRQRRTLDRGDQPPPPPTGDIEIEEKEKDATAQLFKCHAESSGRGTMSSTQSLSPGASSIQNKTSTTSCQSFFEGVILKTAAVKGKSRLPQPTSSRSKRKPQQQQQHQLHFSSSKDRIRFLESCVSQLSRLCDFMVGVVAALDARVGGAVGGMEGRMAEAARQVNSLKELTRVKQLEGEERKRSLKVQSRMDR